jgi:hypothetical protein
MPVTPRFVSKSIMEYTTFSKKKGQFEAKFPFLVVDLYELAILWTLVKENPMSIWELSKRKFSPPKTKSKEALLLGNKAYYVSKMTEPPDKKSYSFVYQIVRRLYNKGLIKITQSTAGERKKDFVAPTLVGIVYFLQNSDIKKNVPVLAIHHPDLLPFLNSQEQLEKCVGKRNFYKALKKTVLGLEGVKEKKTKVTGRKGLEWLEFTIFVESPEKVISPLSHEEFRQNCEKGNKLRRFLGSNEAVDLRNSYITYLAMRDLETLKRLDTKDCDDLLPKLLSNLRSEKELAYFEKRQIGEVSLFRSRRFADFFPKYCTLECFFTGIFIHNLLWEENSEIFHD